MFKGGNISLIEHYIIITIGFKGMFFLKATTFKIIFLPVICFKDQNNLQYQTRLPWKGLHDTSTCLLIYSEIRRIGYSNNNEAPKI